MKVLTAIAAFIVITFFYFSISSVNTPSSSEKTTTIQVLNPIEDDKVISLVSDEWCPFQCVGENKGITFEILSEVFGNEGYKIKQTLVPWSRAIKMLRENNSTTFGNAAKADAPELIYTEESGVTMYNTLFVNSNNKFNFENSGSLQSGIFGTITGYTYGDEIDAYIKKNATNKSKVLKLSGESPLPRLLKMIAEDRIQFTIDDLTVTTYKLKSMDLDKKVVSNAIVSEVPLHMGFSPKNPKAKEYSQKVSNWLKEAKRNGKLKSIYNKYGVECKLCEN
jgi:polar amino acid transport system substrate-binding protein